MEYLVRGKIGANRGSAGRQGQYTYLAEIGACFYIWDGAHKASRFASAEEGLSAAETCQGPWFNMPDPATVESIQWPADISARLAP